MGKTKVDKPWAQKWKEQHTSTGCNHSQMTLREQCPKGKGCCKPEKSKELCLGRAKSHLKD